MRRRSSEHADNMTDRLAALASLAESDLPERAHALASFYERWQDDALVIDKWFALQAQTPAARRDRAGHAAARRTRRSR